MSKIASTLTILAALVLSTFLLTSCLPGPEATTATSSTNTNEDTTTESATQATSAAPETSAAATQVETTAPTTAETTTATKTAATSATQVTDTTTTTSATNEIHTLTGTFQGSVWGDFLHVDILGDDGVAYSFFVVNCDSEVDVESLTVGQKVIVTWQNIDKELPIGDTKEVHNIDELLTLELADE